MTTQKKIEYAKQRAKATRGTYAISQMGHVMCAAPSNIALIESELGGIYAMVSRNGRVAMRGGSEQ